MLGLVALVAAVLLTLALLSHREVGETVDAGPRNYVGPFGAYVAGSLKRAFGWMSWAWVVELGLAAFRWFTRRRALLGRATIATTFVFLVMGGVLLHLCFASTSDADVALPGGLFGEVLGEVLRSLLGSVGALLVCGCVLLLTLMLRAPVSPLALTARAASWAWRWGTWLAQNAAAVMALARQRSSELRRRWQSYWTARQVKLPSAVDTKGGAEATLDAPLRFGNVAMAYADTALATPDTDHDTQPGVTALSSYSRVLHGGPAVVPSTETEAQLAEVDDVHDTWVDIHPGDDDVALATNSRQSASARVSRRRVTKGRAIALPSTQLLDVVKSEGPRVSEATLRANAALLIEKLQAYGVSGRVDEIHPGPVVTMYEFEPESGTKIAKIASLSDDLALALAAQKVRIVAPIPGKARVGFELPNAERQTVGLRDIVEDPRWGATVGALPMALGKDISGRPCYCDLAKMPHLLVAGATGAGKSVGLNVMLVSLLLKKTPQEVRMLMIDPKVVELAVFDGIPHMLLPVVTDMKKAALALRWAVEEMERRYQLFAAAGARSISSFNERVQRVQRGEVSAGGFWNRPPTEAMSPSERGAAEDIETKSFELIDTLPSVVVVVDEFADLMMVAAKEVETAVARLAQKARAAGIHVILATQRPSVDVITGMIKANFPARIGFRVAQREDSKTILGRSGAEHLLGAGDMLMIPPGSSDLKRIHCAYISEDEVRRVCDDLRSKGAPVYDESILRPRDEDSAEEGASAGASSGEDAVYDRAVSIVAGAGYCSISQIQRHLGIGYNKAAKLVERMEKDAVVGPPSGKAGGRREVLVSGHA